MSYFRHETSGDEAAALLGVSRRTIYRWIEEGRLAYPLTRADILSRRPQVRPRGPQRRPYSKRYLYGRHNPHGRNWQKTSA